MENEEIIKTPNFKNIADVLKHYNLTYQKSKFIDFKNITPTILDDKFLIQLDFVLSKLGSDDKESFMSEFIIVPFLREAWMQHIDLNLFSHVQLKFDGYVLIPDYIIAGATKHGFKQLETPLLITVEAKFEQFYEGWKQAALQMLAARKLNNSEAIPIYAIVTTGKLWEFGKMENNIVYQHPTSISIEYPNHITGILSHIFGECEKNAKLKEQII